MSAAFLRKKIMQKILFCILFSVSNFAFCQNFTGIVQDVHATVKNQEIEYVIVIKVRNDLFRFYTRRLYVVGDKVRVHLEVTLIE